MASPTCRSPSSHQAVAKRHENVVGALRRVPPLAAQQEEKVFIDLAYGGTPIGRERMGRHGKGLEDPPLD
jgi:hypothetical protein